MGVSFTGSLYGFWGPSAVEGVFLPSTSRLHRDSYVMETFLRGAFWRGLFFFMFEGSKVTSSSLPSYQKIFPKTLLSCQSFTKTSLEPESFSTQLNPSWSFKSEEKPYWETAAQSPSHTRAWKPPYRAMCWFWQVVPRLESPWTRFTSLGGSHAACLSYPLQKSSAAIFHLWQVFQDSHFWAEHHWVSSTISLDTFKDQWVLAVLLCLASPRNSSFSLQTLTIFSFVVHLWQMSCLVLQHKWRKMWKILTNCRC